MTTTGDEAKTWVERVARLGYAATALLYATVGILAGKAALSQGGGATDTRGAMVAVFAAPFGHVMLALTALGLVGYAVWRIVEAGTDSERYGGDAKGIAKRAGLVLSAIVHLVLAWTAIRIVLGQSARGGASETQRASAKAMTMPYGIWLVWTVGAVLVVLGLYQLYRMWAAKLSSKLDLSRMTGQDLSWVIPVSRFGIGARGVVFGVIGVLTMRAAMNHAPRGGGGIREALQALAKMGSVPLGIVAAGLLAYAVYQLVEARYRRMHLT